MTEPQPRWIVPEHIKRRMNALEAVAEAAETLLAFQERMSRYDQEHAVDGRLKALLRAAIQQWHDVETS